MKRELATVVSVLAVVSCIATIVSAKWWVCLLSFVAIGSVIVFFGMRRLKKSHPLPENPVFTDGPYTVFPADESDILWAAETGRRVYTGIDIIPRELMLEWCKANPNGFFVVKDRHGHRCGNIDILPLRPDTLRRFLSGEIIEQDIRGDCLFHPSEAGQIADLYVESVVAIDAHYKGNPYAAHRIILTVPAMLSKLCPQEKLSKIYAVGGSSNGVRLMQHLGFDMISAGDGRKDKHKVFVTEMADLIHNIAEFAGSPGERDMPSEQTKATIMLMGPKTSSGLDTYMLKECERVFLEHFNAHLVAPKAGVPSPPDRDMVVIGTAENNPTIKSLIENGFLDAESKQEGYSVRCAPHPQNAKVWLLAIAGVDSRGVLWALRDMEHYERDRFKSTSKGLSAMPFSRRDYPRVEHRGHWVWGVNMPDKKAWMENMSRWKLNELIHWDNYPPKKAKEYVDFAHSRGIRVIWGFGWGWNPDWNFEIPKEFDWGVGGPLMCGSNPFNRKFMREGILKKIRTEYVPTGCDGVYFQSFTEGNKCACTLCKDKSMGQLMLEFVNPIVADIKKEFPDLWVSCGIHANFGNYKELEDIDPRCNIYWENCPPGTSVRGPQEDFGYINKTLPYAHGFSKTCPADPKFTEESLTKWMKGNARRYTINGDIETYYKYMRKHQEWAAKLLGKPSTKKHATTVADHSVFCRRTPFMHVALAEALWNPNLDTEPTVDKMIAFLKANGGVDGLTQSASQLEQARVAQHDAVGKPVKLATKYDAKYTGGGDKALTNGRRASRAEAKDRAWQGYKRQNLDVVIDLEEPMSINSLSTGFLQQLKAGVYLPKQVEYAFSRDGKAYEVIGVVKGDSVKSGQKDMRKSFQIEGLDLERVRYLRVRADYVKEWLFVDEIMLNPIQP